MDKTNYADFMTDAVQVKHFLKSAFFNFRRLFLYLSIKKWQIEVQTFVNRKHFCWETKNSIFKHVSTLFQTLFFCQSNLSKKWRVLCGLEILYFFIIAKIFSLFLFFVSKIANACSCVRPLYHTTLKGSMVFLWLKTL